MINEKLSLEGWMPLVEDEGWMLNYLEVDD